MICHYTLHILRSASGGARRCRVAAAATGGTGGQRSLQRADQSGVGVGVGVSVSAWRVRRWVKNPEALPNRAAPASEKKAAALTSKFKEAASDDDNMARGRPAHIYFELRLTRRDGFPAEGFPCRLPCPRASLSPLRAPPRPPSQERVMVIAAVGPFLCAFVRVRRTELRLQTGFH